MSASPLFIDWLREQINKFVFVKGHLSHYKDKNYVQLRYAKKEAIILCNYMYYKKGIPFLKRKHLKIQKIMGIIRTCRSGEIGKHASFRS